MSITAFCILDSNCQFSYYTTFWILGSNCQFSSLLHFAFWIPIVNSGFQLSIFLPFCVLHFGFQFTIIETLPKNSCKPPMNIQCAMPHPPPPPTTPTQINLLAQPCPHCMWALPPLMSAKVDQPVGSISPLNRKCMPSNYQPTIAGLAGLYSSLPSSKL